MSETWFGHYRLDRLLGGGGTGQVWLAWDTVADRAVALKMLAASHAADPTYRLRFTREARLAAQVPGPHTVPIHAFGELDGRLYIDMEFIEGTDVGALLQRAGPMAPAGAVAIIAQTATALDAAERAGLAHRDVKPSNIMVRPDGFVQLIDFGIAHRVDQPAITTYGNVIGTLGYMAPERFNGIADARADQYSLACVLYECLTGQRPFGNIDAPQQLFAHLAATPPSAAAANSAVPVALDTVIARAMAKDPSQRWPSAGDFAAAAYAAVTGRDASTVEITAATTSALPEPWGVAESRGAGESRVMAASDGAGSRQELGDRHESIRGDGQVSDRELGWAGGPGRAVAVIAALIGVIGWALWLGRPGGAETSSAAPSPARSAPVHSSATPHPAESVRAAAPNAVIPIAGQPCNPAVDGDTVARDGTLLVCRSVGGSTANWIPAQSSGGESRSEGEQSASANSGNSDSVPGNLGGGNSGGGNSASDKPGNGKHGHGKPAKPGK
ncbi:serine/threonine protein kinase [Nocardia sp. NBC_00565]|uniref:serine/threonine-protein kinase n=1 Tax=Nocardia sp. NBC_00565 TaxID=2975993 RepID=UPI002E813D9B|nr:serine/threonine-protein kinase [Nocardia sp. NBC_00565]WUC03061.1 serine/threonine protein kinase [Nocardia sp. NBC_00565]